MAQSQAIFAGQARDVARLVAADGQWVGAGEAQGSRTLALILPRLGVSTEREDALGVPVRHALPNGLQLLRWQAMVSGLPVLEGELTALVDAGDRLVAWSADAALHGHVGTALKTPGAALSPEMALNNVLEALDVSGVSVLSSTQGVGGWWRMSLDSERWSRPPRMREVAWWDGEALHRAWEVEMWVPQADTDSVLEAFVVDAVDGQVLRRHVLTHDLSWRVWADETGDMRPWDGPLEDSAPHPTGQPDGWIPANASSVLVELDGFNQHGDPWLVPGATTTAGNHVHAYTDHYTPDGFSEGDVYAEQTSDGVFDHAYDLTLGPTDSDAQVQGAIVQAFYTVAWLHDWFYDAGFDELAGNAQVDNYGRGGLEGDGMNVEVQDNVFAGRRNNANMSTPSDGSSPRMQIYVWSGRSEAGLALADGTDFPVGVASFGPNEFDVTADLVLPGGDGQACVDIEADVSGAVVLIERGNCSFQGKAARAEAAGAIGVVLMDNVSSGTPPQMGSSSGEEPVSIGMLSVTQADGEDLLALLDAGAVEVTLYRSSEPEVEGGLDSGVIAHEWGHYFIGRLANPSSTQGGAIHEGWADFMSLYQSLRDGDDLDGTYAVAAYASSGISIDAAYYGIRRVPYSRDPARNALRFRHISEGEELPVNDHPMASDSSSNTEVHNAGEIWASTMFDAYLALVEDGFEQGRDFAASRRRMSEIMVAGAMLAPTDPTFLELRDALLLAAAAIDPQDAAVMAAAFAGRGMGSCAVGPDRYSMDLTGIIEDYDVSPRLSISAPDLDDGLVSCDEDGVVDGGELGAVSVTVTNPGGAELRDAVLQISVDPSPAGLYFVDGDTVRLDLAPYTAQDVVLPIHILGDEAELTGSVITATLSHDDACEQSVQSESWAWMHVDTQSQQSSTEDFDAADGSWSVGGDQGQAEEIWGQVVDVDGDGAWIGVDVSGVTDTWLQSPLLRFAADAIPEVHITHRYSFEGSEETWWDGGVIELQVDGGDWLDIEEWTSAGYDGVLTDAADNPLQGRSAFSGSNAAWPERELLVLVLGESLAGRDVSMRFRIGTDQAAGDVGWEISQIDVLGLAEAPFPVLAEEQDVCNPAPVADAGADQSVSAGAWVALDGSGSFDPVGEALTHVWTASGGVSVEDADAALAGFVAPDVDVETVITVTLTVDDGAQQDSDQVDVLVLPGDVDEEDTASETPAPQQRPSGCACSSTGHRPVSAMVWLWVIVCWGGRRRMGS